jgi:Fe-S-cluster containining protein
VKPRDIERLARHFSISVEAARERFTKKGEDPGEIVLRHQRDEHFGTVCRFLDLEKRRCTVYEARPAVCREFPGTVRCGYYDFLKFERRNQEDEEYVSTTWNA